MAGNYWPRRYAFLKVLDEVAYIRFASVYRQFKDVESFKEELQKLLEVDL